MMKNYKTRLFQCIFENFIKLKWQVVISIVLIVINIEATTELGKKKIHI